MSPTKRKFGRKTTNNSATEQGHKQEEHTKASGSTGTTVESILGQPEETEQTSATPVGKRFTPPTKFHSQRVRKAVQRRAKKMNLVRVPLKQPVVASPQSVELWGVRKTSYNGRIQTEEFFLVPPELQDVLEEHLRPIKVQVILNQDGSHSLLYTKLTDGYENTWMDSAEDCSEQLEQGWGRVISDRSQQQYVFVPANNGKAVPAADEYPNLDEVIAEVFADRTIRDLTDPVLEDMGIYIDPDQAA